jgi:hypothetical protein
MDQLGRLLLIGGAATALLGIILMFGPGRLPLTFHFQRGNFNFYFPLGASLLLSLVLTLIFALLNRR